MADLTPEQAWSRLTTWCARAERAEHDVREKLRGWGIRATSTQDDIVERLREEQYLNTERYCRAYVHDKFYLQRWGKRKIREGLYMKRISAACIEEALCDIDEEKYRETLTNILQSKLQALSNKETVADSYQLAQQLFRFAYGRGYDTENIQACLRALGNDWEVDE